VYSEVAGQRIGSRLFCLRLWPAWRASIAVENYAHQWLLARGSTVLTISLLFVFRS